jgi:hypothetical protein
MSDDSYEKIDKEDLDDYEGEEDDYEEEEEEDSMSEEEEEEEPVKSRRKRRSNRPKRTIPDDYPHNESAEAFVRTSVGDILLWKNPLQSGLWFSTIFLMFFLTIFSEYSLMTLLCYIILLQLLFTNGIIRAAPSLSKMGLLRANFNPKTFAMQRQAFSIDELKKFAKGSAGIIYSWIQIWNEALSTDDAQVVLSVAFSLFVLAIVGKIMTLSVFLFIIFLGAFTCPKIYSLQSEKFDDLYYQAQDKFEDVWDVIYDKIGPVLDKVLAILRPIIGEFYVDED